MRRMFISSAALVLCLALAAFGQTNGQQNNGMNQQDKQFVTMVAKANRGEIEMGNFAQQHASNDEVKQFAQLMVTDHTNAGQQLKSWASQSNVTLPSGLTAQDNSTKASLSSASGSQFDKQYIQSQLQDHKKVIAAFEKEVQQGQDPQLKQFAEKTLPVLQDHVRIAEDVAGKLGLSGKMGLSNESKAINAGQSPSK